MGLRRAIMAASSAPPANFRDFLLSLSPLAYYPMDETSGTLVDALAGTDGTYLGSPTLGNAAILPNDPGGSMGTTAVANRAQVNRALSGNPDFTCCLAIRTSATSTQMLIFDQDLGTGGTPRHFLAINRNDLGNVTIGAVCVFGHAPSGQTNRNAAALSAGVSDGQPHFIMWGRNFGTVFIDVDGVPQTLSGSTTMSQSIFGGTYWGVGQSPIAGAPFQYVGDAAHFACWDRALSLTERGDLAAAAGF